MITYQNKLQEVLMKINKERKKEEKKEHVKNLLMQQGELIEVIRKQTKKERRLIIYIQSKVHSLFKTKKSRKRNQ